MSLRKRLYGRLEIQADKEERAAMQAHIDDLRQIAFAKCGVPETENVRRMRFDD